MPEDQGVSAGRKIALIPVHIYRKYVSPALKPRCRFYPSCSEYFELAVTKYGVFRGSAKGIYRIMRCHPFAEGGYDPP
ncbi:MAG: membrane protein insertion efficiency factor YidD [Candidatus Geothermincolia bacterium]